MAESKVFRVPKDTTVTFTDGSGSPKVLTLRIHSGTCSMVSGGVAIVRAKDTNGRYLGPPRDGGQAGATTVQLEVLVYEVDDGTDLAQADVLRQVYPAGSAAAGMVTAGDSPDFTELDFKMALAAAGDNPAQNISLSNCVVQPGASLTMSPEGMKLSVTLESPDIEPTYAAV